MNDVPSGSQCFIDANMLFYYFVDTPPFSDSSTRLLRRIVSGDVQGFTSIICASEALHRVMLAEVQGRYSKTKPLAYIQRRPHLIATLTDYRDAAKRIHALNLQLLTLDLSIYPHVATLASRHSLLTNDATTLALIEHHRISHIATNDDDFKDIPGITVWNPR